MTVYQFGSIALEPGGVSDWVFIRCCSASFITLSNVSFWFCRNRIPIVRVNWIMQGVQHHSGSSLPPNSMAEEGRKLDGSVHLRWDGKTTSC